MLPAFVETYKTCELSALAKRVLGCFLFQTLDDHLRIGGDESLVWDTLNMLAEDNRIHEPEFRYWSLVDLADSNLESDAGFSLTKYATEFVRE